MFLASIRVTLKPTINDPQGQTILSGLNTMGFTSIQSIRMGKYLEIQLDAPDSSTAESQVHEMCNKLLANPIIEDFAFEVTDLH